jgi:hypothetical protein
MASQQPLNHFSHPQQQLHHLPHPALDDDAVAAADKEMEERAQRAKELLSQRYDAIRQQQVSSLMQFRFLMDSKSLYN